MRCCRKRAKNDVVVGCGFCGCHFAVFSFDFLHDAPYRLPLPSPATDATVIEFKEYKEWMNRHGIAGSTILLGMEPRLQNEYMGVKDAKELWEKLATAYRTKLQLNIFDIREDLLNLRLEDCEGVDSYVLKIDEKVSAYNLCADSTETTATGGDDSDTIPKMSKQEHVFYLL